MSAASLMTSASASVGRAHNVLRGLMQGVYDEMGLAWRNHERARQASEAACLQPDPKAASALVEYLTPRAAFLQAMAGLSVSEIKTLTPMLDGSAPVETLDQRRVIDAHPAISGWFSERAAAAALAEEVNRVAREREIAAYAADAPARLVRGLRAKCVDLTLDKQGRLTIRPAGSVTDVERAELAEHKSAVADLLRAEAPSELVIA